MMMVMYGQRCGSFFASVASFEEQIRMKDKHILELQFRVANVKDDDA